MATSGDELAPFVLHKVDGLDEETGRGAYGVVWDVKVNNLPCIAKRLHSILVNLEVSSEERGSIQGKFRQECILLSKLRHPNIVHFVGVSYGKNPGDLTLVMEKVLTDLAKLMVGKPASSLPIKLSLLCDVSYGLLYLHTLDPPILHRDLTPKNVLVTGDLRAKLADLGGSKQLLDLNAAGTLAPGATNYMPPEALKEGGHHDARLDLFSFGHLSLFTIAQKEPHMSNDCITRGVRAHGIVEITRRQKDIGDLGRDHCLYLLIIHCLQDKPEKRPSTLEVNTILKNLCLLHPRNLEGGMKACEVSSEVDVVEQLQMELAKCQAEVELHKLKAQTYKEDFEQERKDRERAVFKESEVSERYKYQLSCIMEELQRSSEKVKNLQQGKERLITKVQELALQVEHYKRAAETSRRDVEDSREQAEEMRRTTQQCTQYRIEADVCRRDAEAKRKEIELYKEQVKQLKMEPERKHKKRSKSMTGGRDIDVFERRCAELEKQIDRLQQENMRLFRENEGLKRYEAMPVTYQRQDESVLLRPASAEEELRQCRAIAEPPDVRRIGPPADVDI